MLPLDETNEIALIRLKHPFGKLLIGSPERTMSMLKEKIKCEKPTKIFAVGDIVASNMIKNGIDINSVFVDFKSERQSLEPFKLSSFKVIKVKNQASTLTSQVCETVKRTVQGTSAKAIVVDGEEDLLTLPAVRFAPQGALIVYGQPHVGIVLIRVTDKVKDEAEILMDSIRKRALTSAIKG